MPSTATITAFYTFTANTKARASLVNANFDIFRGHLLPLSPSTQTAINNTYDLGSSEYRWKTGYFREVDIQSSTTTGQALQITGLTSGSDSAFVFNIGGNEKARIGSSGIPSSSLYFEMTFGGLVESISFNTIATSEIATLACSIVGNGNPVEVGFTPASSAFVQPCVIYTLSNVATTTSALVEIYRNTTTSLMFKGQFLTKSQGEYSIIPATAIRFYDNSAPAGAITYKVHAWLTGSLSANTISLTNLKLYAKKC